MALVWQQPLPKIYTELSDSELRLRIAAAREALGRRLIILGHLGSREHSWRLERAGAALKPNAPAAWTLGILLLACSGIAALLSEQAWAYNRSPACDEATNIDGCPSVATMSALLFGISLAAGPWLSAAFADVQLALGRTTKGVALLWFGAALFGLLLLVMSIGISSMPSPE